MLDSLKETKNRFSLVNSEEAELVDQINDSLLWGGMNYLRENGFLWVEVPTITKITGACENVDTLYSLNHFGQEAYLAQTGQLYLEAKIPKHPKLWTIIASSRAEVEADSRHLNQFQLLEFEHHGNLENLLVNIEGIVKAMLSECFSQNETNLRLMNRKDELRKWVESPFNRITYSQAIELLQEIKPETKWGKDLSSEDEKYLAKSLGNKPLFITHYPKAIKFFNMRQNDENPKVVNSTDLIMPYAGESVGAAERENNYTRLVERLVESPMFKNLQRRGKSLDDFQDYLELVKKYPILHSGCGIGFSRVSQSVLGSSDIRTTTSFPLQSDVLY